MIVNAYIYKRDGSLRVVDYHQPDPSDSDLVKSQFARLPPVNTVDWQLEFDEMVFPTLQSPAQLLAAFGPAPILR